MVELLLCLITITAIAALQVEDLLVSVVILAVFSLLCAVLFFILHAPDVAIAEAAVGAGVSTVILLWAVHRTSGMRP